MHGLLRAVLRGIHAAKFDSMQIKINSFFGVLFDLLWKWGLTSRG